MRSYDLDWLICFDQLRVWNQISAFSQRWLIKASPSQMLDLSEFGEDAQLLRKHRFLKGPLNAKRVSLHPESLPFFKFLTSLRAHDILGRPSKATFSGYLRHHFSNEQRLALFSSTMRYGNVDRMLIDIAISTSWVRGFLSTKNGVAWELKRTSPYLGEATRFQRSGVVDAAKKLIRWLIERGEPAPLHQLPSEFSQIQPKTFGLALGACIRYLLLFPALRYEDMTPMIDVWPTTGEKLRAPKPSRPQNLEPQERLHCAYRVEDMSVLLAAARQPLPIKKSNSKLFDKVVKDLKPQMVALPDWLQKPISPSLEQRVFEAQSSLVELGFARKTSGAPKRAEFSITSKGKNWLAKDRKQRLGEVLQHIAKKHLVPRSLFYEIEHNRGLDPKSALLSAFRGIPVDEDWPLDQFLQWRSQSENPLIEFSQSSPHGLYLMYAYRHPTEEEMESKWRGYLETFVRDRLLPLGALSMGYCRKSQQTTLRMTSVGRFFLGQETEFKYGLLDERQGQVIIGPNFEITFLRPWPLAEAFLAQYAQRVGTGLGVLFRITKEAVLSAAANGMQADPILEELGQIAEKGVPPNVEREIRGWLDQCRHIKMREAILIRCPDIHTAGQIKAAGGAGIESISDTVLELSSAESKTKLLKKLSKLGIFVD